VIAEWDIELTSAGINTATWEVVATSKGNHETTLYATNLDDNKWVNNDWTDEYTITVYNETEDGLNEIPYRSEAVYPTSHANLAEWDTVSRADNFDDSYWLVDYPSVDTGVPAEVETKGEALADGGSAAYDQMVTNGEGCGNSDDSNWGFTERAPDCENKVYLTDGNLLHPVASVPCEREEVEIFVSVGYEERLKSHGYYLEPSHNRSAIGQTLVANTYMKDLMCDWDQPPVSAVNDGLPRLAQALAHPDIEHAPTSLFYGDVREPDDLNPGLQATYLEGANGFQAAPGSGYCEIQNTGSVAHGGSAALLWGHYASQSDYQDGIEGEQIYQVISVIDNRIGYGQIESDECDPSAMYWGTGEISDYDAYVSDSDDHRVFTEEMYRTGFVWDIKGETRDWGEHLLPVTSFKAVESDAGDDYENLLQPWGTEFIDLPTNRTYEVDCSLSGGSDLDPSYQLMLEDGSGLTVDKTADCLRDTLTVNGEAYDRVVLNVVNDENVGDWHYVDLK
jgi:hypothetical protein